jgi:membrane fusion protein, multidrug efflux system
MLDRVTNTPPLDPSVDAPEDNVAQSKPRRRLTAKNLRKPLLIAGPLLVALVALGLWLTGGRYVSTDNAYIGANTVMVTPQVTGTVSQVAVHQGQRVTEGDLLFEIDPEPYRIALETARGQLEASKLDLAALKERYAKAVRDAATAQTQLDYQLKNFARIRDLNARTFAAQSELDQAQASLNSAQGALDSAKQDASEQLANLGGDPNLPLEKYPAFMQAQANVDQAQRNLRLTETRAPISGVVTQAEMLLTGRYLAPGTVALAVVDVDHAWVDANPKETDIQNVLPGQPVTITVDAYPDHAFTGRVDSINPGTDAQFSLIPAQNASGNWVKVVQRVPLHILIDHKDGDPILRSGISAVVSVDTGKSRSLSDLF